MSQAKFKTDWDGSGKWKAFAAWANAVSRALNRVTCYQGGTGEFNDGGLKLDIPGSAGGSDFEVSFVTRVAWESPQLVEYKKTLTMSGGVLSVSDEDEGTVIVEADPCS